MSNWLRVKEGEIIENIYIYILNTFHQSVLILMKTWLPGNLDLMSILKIREIN